MPPCVEREQRTRPTHPVPGQHPWEQLQLFEDEPTPIRDLLVAWAVGYSPAEYEY